MLRYVFNSAFLTIATNIQWYSLSLLLPESSSALAALLQQSAAAVVDDSYNFNKQKKGKWKHAGKETSTYSLAPLPFAFLRLDEASK